MSNLINAERNRLAPFVERLDGTEMRAEFWAIFDSAAGTFARGRYDAGEFRGIVGELIRDASGTAAGQDRAADAARDAERGKWATMPRDGSARLTLPERVVYILVGLGCTAALLMIAWTLGMFGDSSPAAPDTRTAVQIVSDADKITQGGYWSWSVADGCARGPAECETVMREVNASAARYGLRVFEDGSIAPAGVDY